MVHTCVSAEPRGCSGSEVRLGYFTQSELLVLWPAWIAFSSGFKWLDNDLIRTISQDEQLGQCGSSVRQRAVGSLTTNSETKKQL